jgi:hypothetical protein
VDHLLEPAARSRPDDEDNHPESATDHDRATLIASVRLALEPFAQPNLSQARHELSSTEGLRG